MVEFVLNLVWVVTACLLLLRFCIFAQSRKNSPLRRLAVASILAFVMLPVISMSDDMLSLKRMVKLQLTHHIQSAQGSDLEDDSVQTATASSPSQVTTGIPPAAWTSLPYDLTAHIVPKVFYKSTHGIRPPPVAA